MEERAKISWLGNLRSAHIFSAFVGLIIICELINEGKLRQKKTINSN